MHSAIRYLAVGIAAAATLIPGSAPQAVSLFDRPVLTVGANRSNNWSGYNQGLLEQGNKQFHSVTGDWTVPTATAHKAGENEYSSTWIGIGGGCIDAGCLATDASLIQAGTEQDVDSSGAAHYSAWWEAIPAPSVAVSLPVAAGDRIHADLSETLPGIWSVTLKNLTRGQSFNLTLPYGSTYATAEWIEETPVAIDNSGNVSIGPLPNLSTVKFDLATTNHAAAALKASEEVQLVDAGNNPLATPSSPDPDADGFNDCAHAGSCGAPSSS